MKKNRRENSMSPSMQSKEQQKVPSKPFILTINGGSSSIKFALFQIGAVWHRTLSGKIERIGLPEGTLTLTDLPNGRTERQGIQARDHADSGGPRVSSMTQ